MKINRVALTNYRIHSSLEVTFENGINLLLGKNGTGKSSILEAVGLTLFDADLRSTQSEAIKKGEKSAIVKVEITGNDEKEYTIERKIGSGAYTRLYLKGEKSARIESREEILEKVKELSGISSNEKNIYQNVITAYQNKIVNIFAETPANRERIFNQIFDTSIYQQMYERFAKDYRDKYKKEIEFSEKNLLFAKEQLKDSKELRENLKQKKELKKSADEKLKTLNKQLKELEKESTRFDKLKQQFEKSSSSLEHSEKLLTIKESEQTKTKENIKHAAHALEIIKETQTDYELYLKTKTELEKLNKSIDNLEIESHELEKSKEELKNLEAKEQKNRLDLKHGHEIIKDKENELKKISQKQEKLSEEKSSLEYQLSEIEKSGQKIKEINNNFLNDYDSIKKQSETMNNNLKLIEHLNNEQLDLEKINQDLSKQKVLQEENQINLKQKENLELTLTKEKTRLTELKNAEQTLSQKTCPFLAEECLNLKQESSPEKYFNERRLELETKINNIKTKLEKFKKTNKKLTECEQNIARLKHELEKNSEIQNKLKELKGNNELIIKTNTINELKIEKTLANYSTDLDELLVSKQYEEIKLYLKSKREELVHNYKTSSNFLNVNSKELNATENDRNSYQDQIVKQQNILTQAEKDLQTLAENKNNIQAKINHLNVKLNKLPTLKTDRTKINSELSNLATKYEKYLANKQKATKLDSLQKNSAALESDIAKLISAIEQEKIKIIELNSNYSETGHNKIKNSIKELNQNKETEQSQLPNIVSELNSAEKDLTENKKQTELYEQNKQVLKKYQQKLELANKFRDNLKGMGKLVATKLITSIENSATLNYQKISGKNEQIRWVNSEKESYTVFLCKGSNFDNARKFELLSGGEQVAVALALRAAMASLLTKSNFAIFDEPTINLDSEKRIALAESLKSILSKLKQAIIVTHDDTFREMAQKIITLD
jgi:exonuclease SbcC